MPQISGTLDEASIPSWGRACIAQCRSAPIPRAPRLHLLPLLMSQSYKQILTLKSLFLHSPCTSSHAWAQSLPPTQPDRGHSDLCPREQRMVLRIVPVMGKGSSHTKCDSQWCPCLGAPRQSTAAFTMLPWGVTHQESGGITGKLCFSSRSSEPQQQRGPC